MSMKQDASGMYGFEEEEPSAALQSTPTETSLPAAPLKKEEAGEALSVQALAALCLSELENNRRGEPGTDEYGLALLRRAIVRGDQEAWAWIQHCFGGLVRGWLRRHPQREIAGRLESEENYVAQAFERFWQATTLSQRVEFNSLTSALQYLHASLNGAILDTLRAYARPGEVSLPEPGEPGEPYEEDVTESSEVWEGLQTMLLNEREQQLAYLLFHGGLKPRQIVRFRPQEFGDVQEIYRMRRNMMERLLRNVDQLRWRLR
jgi:hypothetical protein